MAHPYRSESAGGCEAAAGYTFGPNLLGALKTGDESSRLIRRLTKSEIDEQEIGPRAIEIVEARSPRC
jgi:hypothetical protein